MTLHLILIAVLGIIIYSNTFGVPFQWDERRFIIENPIVKDTDYFLYPSSAKGLELYGGLKSRYAGYLTFALNYKVHGLDVRGYHAVNLLIHILNAFLVYFLLRLILKTPGLSSFPEIASASPRNDSFIPLFTALLFVSHPVQTEAVTYIFQRFASLAAFFYLLSLVLYIKWRQTPPNLKFQISNLKFYFMSLISAVLAMKTKENAFTLPLVIMLYEFMFFRGDLKRRFLPLVPFLLTMLIIPLSLIDTGGKPLGEAISSIGAGYENISRKEYFLTSLRVVVTYIRLLFLPINQNLDYDYPISRSFFEPEVLLSFLFLSGLLGFAVYLLYKSRIRNPILRIISFGMLWFFITLSVESGPIALMMVINEYRLYLPSMGFFMAAGGGAFMLLERLTGKRRMILIIGLILVLTVLSYSAYQRNSLWRDGITLWQDVVRKSPENPRGHYNLGVAYMSGGLIDNAIEQYDAAIYLKPDYTDAHINIGSSYASKGLTDKAMEHFTSALKIEPDNAEAYYNLGIAYYSKDKIDEAIQNFRKALNFRPDFPKAYNNLGAAYYKKGLLDLAVKHYLFALKLKPDSPEVHNNLGSAYASKGLIDEAIKHFQAALKLEPGFEDARLNLSNAYNLKQKEQ